jgi:2-oxoisovalerate dehydrogenase E1 component
MALQSLPSILTERDLRPGELEGAAEPALRRIYAWMYYARTVDNRNLELFRQGLMKGTLTGGQGNEGLIVPLILLADKSVDVVSFTHRDLGGHLIWGGHLCEHLNQYFANAESPTRAREGNIHHGDPANRSIPMISHLGAMCGVILGATDSQRRKGRQAVGFAFFGDGSSSTGDIHESMNLASLLSLPVLFVIENNRYAYSTPVSEQFAAGTELWKRAAGYGIEGRVVDATDAPACAKALAAAIAQVRATSRPMLVEAQTLRLRGHAAYDTCSYLKPGESEAFLERDPVPRLRARLAGLIGEPDLRALEAGIDRYVESCFQTSLAVPRPKPDAADMEAGLFAPPRPPVAWVPSVDPKPRTEGAPAESLTMAQALNRALRKILAEQPESIVLGQDIGTYGGAFKVTEDLLAEFGRSRVFSTPLAESACTGYAIGMALNGHRPIEEFQFADFVTEAATQLTLNAATMRFRSGAACPLVVRLPCGSVGLGSFHSQELESFLLAMPGLKALYPSTPQDAFNALLAAYEDGNPVILFEHKGLYRRGRQPVAWDPGFREVWKPRRVRSGDHATFVTYGEMVHVAEEACEYLASEYETTFDLFDLRALSPLRLEEIERSLERTGRLVVLHEGRLTHGFGAELVARLTERHFASLKAAPLRIGSLDLPVPFAAELEAAFRPTREKVIEKLAAWIS